MFINFISLLYLAFSFWPFTYVIVNLASCSAARVRFVAFHDLSASVLEYSFLFLCVRWGTGTRTAGVSKICVEYFQGSGIANETRALRSLNAQMAERFYISFGCRENFWTRVRYIFRSSTCSFNDWQFWFSVNDFWILTHDLTVNRVYFFE